MREEISPAIKSRELKSHQHQHRDLSVESLFKLIVKYKKVK